MTTSRQPFAVCFSVKIACSRVTEIKCPVAGSAAAPHWEDEEHVKKNHSEVLQLCSPPQGFRPL